MRLAYFILAHRNPRQLGRLLSAIYDERDLFVVHADRRAPDVRAAAEAFAADRPNVHLLPGRRVLWGGWSQTAVTLEAMRLALRVGGGWDYFLNVSGQDYPLRTPADVRGWLAERGPGLNYMEVLDFAQSSPGIRPRLAWYHFELAGRVRRLRLRRRPHPSLRVHWGSAYFIASRALCELATSGELADQCRRYLRFARSSDEIYFQTLLMNGPLRDTLVPDHRRKIVWPAKSPHPHTFTLADRDELLSTDAFFARKFDEAVDPRILDEIDHHLLARPATTAPRPAHSGPHYAPAGARTDGGDLEGVEIEPA